jgi:hypothetical protein
VFKRTDHIEFLSSQPETIVQFYTDALGFLNENARTSPAPLGPLDLVYLELAVRLMKCCATQNCNQYRHAIPNSLSAGNALL